MTIIVGETERAALKAAMARARTHPVSWEVLQRGIVDRSYAVRIEDLPATHKPSEFVDLPFGYVVAIAFEEHPAGSACTCRYRVRVRRWRRIWWSAR
jgi:hypothetical protein